MLQLEGVCSAERVNRQVTAADNTKLGEGEVRVCFHHRCNEWLRWYLTATLPYH